MTLFTVGPVQMHESTLKTAGTQLPYFRDADFSEVNFRIVKNLKTAMNAPEYAEVVLLTASGTGAMEATVMNLFGQSDKLVVINGGAFGKRFSEICDVHGIMHKDINLKFGETLTKDNLSECENAGFTGLLVNIHETSTGQLYDIKMLSDFCRRNNLVFVVDAISSFLADEFDFTKYGVDATIISSQKALALSPGLSVVVLSERAVELVQRKKVGLVYFDFKSYISDIKRGQTPFTPAVGVLLEMDVRLSEVLQNGVEKVVSNTAYLAEYFRQAIKKLPVSTPMFPLSNALTPILFSQSAKAVYRTLKENYGLVLTPSGGELADKLLRVGHLGALGKEDFDRLAQVLAVVCENEEYENV